MSAPSQPSVPAAGRSRSRVHEAFVNNLACLLAVSKTWNGLNVTVSQAMLDEAEQMYVRLLEADAADRPASAAARSQS